MVRVKLMASGLFLVLQLSGAFLSLWSIWIMKIGKFNIQPELKKNAVMVCTGPYKIIRNPMYSGIILFFGAGIANDYDTINLLVLALLLFIFLLKIFKEEKYMSVRFGEAYIAYQKKTYRLVPFLF
jgi:protein-S-isoprenylcysteine O-methyltransferase Ste14